MGHRKTYRGGESELKPLTEEESETYENFRGGEGRTGGRTAVFCRLRARRKRFQGGGRAQGGRGGGTSSGAKISRSGSHVASKVTGKVARCQPSPESLQLRERKALQASARRIEELIEQEEEFVSDELDEVLDELDVSIPYDSGSKDNSRSGDSVF